jgi:hypothetical protein
MKFKRLFCPTCQAKVTQGLVLGSDVPQLPLVLGDMLFQITITKEVVAAAPVWTDHEIFFVRAPNPLRQLGMIESYVETLAPSIKCTFCRTEIKLERIFPPPPPPPEPAQAANNPYFGPVPQGRAQAPRQVNPALRNVVQQVQQQAQASRFATNVAMVRNIFNNSFTEPDLDVILADLDITMPPGSGKPEKLEALIDHLYS